MGLSDLVGRIEKRFGKEAVVGNTVEVETVSSGSLAFDEALGGGWALGRIHECYGAESSGKTTAALHLCASVQKNLGKAVGYVDVEQALDLEYATKLGVDLSEDKWILSQPNSAEEAMEIVREMLSEKEIGVVILDSVAGLVPTAVLQGEAGDAKVALVARLMSQQLNILKNVCKKNNNMLLCINQIRDKVGGGFGFGGASTTTTGGRALKFYSTQRTEFARIGTDKDGDIAVANETKITIRKNKIAPPYRSCKVYLRFGIGFDIVQETVDLAIKYDICSKRGSFFYYGDYRLGQGMNNVREALEEDVELLNEIRESVSEKICIPKD
jgi:recombination protein RecA